jgi:hypothetical protein
MNRLPSFIREAVTSAKFAPTKYHREPLQQHLEECAKHCQRLAPQFDVPEDLAYDLGLYHDVGKPFVERQMKKNLIYTGHAQIGAYLISRMEHPYKDVLTFVTNHHMCCCSHQRGLGVLSHGFKSLLSIVLPEENTDLCIRALALLFVADMMARVTDDPIDESSLIAYSQDFIDMMLSRQSNAEAVRNICMQKRGCNDKVVILPLGTSGCGKSTFAKSIPQATVIERDQCYFQVGRDHGMEGTYQEIYQAVSDLPDGKLKVQKLFVNRIADALEDSSIKIVVIDTMQSLFHHPWKSMLESLPEDAKSIYGSTLKIGVYLFPQNQLGAVFEPKTGRQSQYPDQLIQFPKVNLEAGVWDPMEIDIGTGDVDSIAMICDRFLRETIIPECPLQGPSLKMGLTPIQTASQFPPGVISIVPEYEDQHWRVQTLTYKDGFQIFTGPTRDYRGESFAFDKRTKTYHLIRGSLPVFPDFCSIEKDPACYPYLQGVWNCRPEWEKLIQFNDRFTLKVTPKYDGSLFNLTFIPDGDFEGIDSPHRCQYGKLFYGSKGRFIAKKPVTTRIANAIEGSYGSRDEFVIQVERFLVNHELTNSRVTLHFEAIDAVPTSELTVYYGRAWCPFFGFTVFTDTEKKFSLPSPDDFSCITTIDTFSNWKEVLEYSERNHESLLQGDEIIEPEGYVVHIFGENGCWLPVKLKYEFYYVAHKPDSKFHREKARAITVEPQYEKLRNRLAKFRDRPSLEHLLSDKVSEFISSVPPSAHEWDRKSWAIYWSEKKDQLEIFGQELSHLVSDHHPHLTDKIKSRPFSVLMKTHGKTPTVSDFIHLLTN